MRATLTRFEVGAMRQPQFGRLGRQHVAAQQSDDGGGEKKPESVETPMLSNDV